jgi:hypothetical protein
MADAVINGKVQPKQTKAMDMQFHWLHDRKFQQQFQFFWRPGKQNYADYWTKHYSAGASHQHAQRIHYSTYSFRNAQYETTTTTTTITNNSQSSIEHCHW